MKLVSIIIPVYNRVGIISETLESVLAQTFQNWQCFVVDDGSTDGTLEKARKIVQGDTRFVFLHRNNSHAKGGSGARNMGWQCCATDWVLFLDSDDVLLPKALEARVALVKDQAYDFLVMNSCAFKKYPGDHPLLWNRLDASETCESLLVRFVNSDMPWNTNSVLWKKAFLSEIGGWDERLSAWQDWDLHTRALLHHPHFLMEDKVDSYFRISEQNSIGSTYKTKRYLQSVWQTLNNFQKECTAKQQWNEELKKSFRIFVIRSLIRNAIARNHKFFPVRVVLGKSFFHGVSRMSFLKYYLLDLISQSTKLKQLFTKTKYHQYRSYIRIKSEHLKLKPEASKIV